MKLKVTERGVTIPRHLLPNVDEVDVRNEGGVLVVVPSEDEDPIFGLGRNPVTSDVSDGSVDHDRYLYRGSE